MQHELTTACPKVKTVYGQYDFYRTIRNERRRARAAAKRFADAVRDGDVDRFYRGVDAINRQSDAWVTAMEMVSKLPPACPAIREAFLQVWIECKGLNRRTGNRRVLANALRVLMPCDYQGAPLRLWRGATVDEHELNQPGFSWTTDLDKARGFADPHTEKLREALKHGIVGLYPGIVLETTAPPDAIILVREKSGYYDEDEVVVDPFKLEAVSLVERR